MKSNGPWRTLKAAAWLLALDLALAGCDAPREAAEPLRAEEVVARSVALTPNPERGRRVFRAWCIFCHGDQATGEPPTDFDLGDENPRRFRSYDLSFQEHVEVIVSGFISRESGRQNMPAFALRLTPQDIADVAAYEQKIMALSPEYQENPERRWQGP